MLGNLGIALMQRGDYGTSTQCLEESRAIAKALSDVSGEGKALGALGLSLQHQGEHRRAIDYYVAGLEIARRIGDVEMTVNACLSLSGACGLIGDDVQAARFLYEARTAARGFPRLLAHVEQTAQAMREFVASQRPGLWKKVSSWLRRPTR